MYMCCRGVKECMYVCVSLVGEQRNVCMCRRGAKECMHPGGIQRL